MSRQEGQLFSPDPWLREKSEKERLKEELKVEVMKELKRRKWRKKLGCCLLGLICLFLILFLVASALAKTGLIEIPFFSKIFYKYPAPIREVKPSEVKSLEEIFQNKIRNQVKEKLISGRETQKVDLKLEFTEQELTAALQEGIKTGFLPVSKVQAAVTSKEIEIFSQLIEPKVFLTLRFKPELQDNQLIIKITKFKIGNLSIPYFFSNFLIEKYLRDKVSEINEFINRSGKLRELRLEEGKIVIEATIDVIIFLEE